MRGQEILVNLAVFLVGICQLQVMQYRPSRRLPGGVNYR
jgi:hypothetical protein